MKRRLASSQDRIAGPLARVALINDFGDDRDLLPHFTLKL